MTRKGVWNLQQVRDKYLQSLWEQSYSLFSWGRNDNMGGLGHNNITAISSPKQVGSQTDWKSVTAGGLGVFLGTKTDGTLWVSGGGAPSSGNTYGQLGLNSRAGYSSPVQVPGTTWDVVGSADSSTLALKTDGTLWSWGYNGYGHLGQGNYTHYSSPVQIPGTTWTSEFSNGLDYSIAIKTDGTLWAWGSNTTGYLGQGNNTQYQSPRQVGSATNWTKCSGSGVAMAVNSDGELYTWGSNQNQGALGLNNTTNKNDPTQVPGTTWANPMAGQSSAGCVKTNGELWMWGKQEDYGSLGVNSRTNISSPFQVPGTTWANIYSLRGSDSPSGNWLATKTDGTLWSWGNNEHGQLGLSNKTRYSPPVQVGSNTNWATGRHSVSQSPGQSYALTQTLTPSQL